MEIPNLIWEMSQSSYVASFTVYCHEHIINFECFMYYDWFLHYDWTMTVGFCIDRQHSKIKNSIFFVTFFNGFFIIISFSPDSYLTNICSPISKRDFSFFFFKFYLSSSRILFLRYTHYFFLLDFSVRFKAQLK